MDRPSEIELATCSQDLQPVEIRDKYLTKNQRKKRRQKLSRLHKRSQIAEQIPCSDNPVDDFLKNQGKHQNINNHNMQHSEQVETVDLLDRQAQQSLMSISQTEAHQQCRHKRPRLSKVLEEEEEDGNRCGMDSYFEKTVGAGIDHYEKTCKQDARCHAEAFIMIAQAAVSSIAQPAGSEGQRIPLEISSSMPSESAASAEDFVDAMTAMHAQEATAIEASGAGGHHQAPQLTALGKSGRRLFLYGNYHRYYGYRLGQAFTEDPRLALFERCWFAGKRCMDVGSNEGLVTLSLATRFGTRSMVGVDIDEALIRKACMHLREARSAAAVHSAEVQKHGVSAVERRTARNKLASLAQTWFVHADFLNARVDRGSIDCLTALSVTKWVHLHRGDQGLRSFFGRVRELLSPGGLFVLEPQPWRSYRAAVSKLKRQGGEGVPLPPRSYFHRTEELELRPEDFPQLLCQEFGFRLLRQLQPPEQTAAGFDRVVLVFRRDDQPL